MPWKNSLLKIFFIAGALPVVLLMVIIFFLPLDLKALSMPSAVKQVIEIPTTQLVKSINSAKASKQGNIGLPVRLTIPKINVDAPIESVGVTSTGAMKAPVGPKEVVWFKFGPHPGNVGSAVIAGHYGPWKLLGPSVFDDLYTLQTGDKIYVQDQQGITTAFEVRKIRQYDKAENAPDVFASTDGKAHLNLVTCQGAWDESQKTYSDRLIIFTDKIITNNSSS